MRSEVDVAIVGSGFGGSIPAHRLSREGMSVVVFERGKRKTPKEFRQAFDPRYIMEMYHLVISSDCSVFFRYGKVLGGGSVVFSGACLRAPSEVFDFTEDGGRPAWPESVDRSVLDPYYDLVEEKMRVTQVAWQEVPKTGGTLARMLDNLGLTCDRGRFNYVGCRQCGFCQAGCLFNAKQSLMLNYIPEAEAMGAVFKPECDVYELARDGSNYVVKYTDRFGMPKELRCRKVVLAGGAIDTPYLLLRSAGNLPGMNDQVGKHLNNNGDVGFAFIIPEDWPPVYTYRGRDNAGVISYAFWEDYRITIHPGSPPPAIVAGLELRREVGEPELPWGLEHKLFIREVYPDRFIPALAMGLVPGAGEISLGPGNSLALTFPKTKEIERHITTCEKIMKYIVEGNGGELLLTGRDRYEYCDAHPLSTSRMSDSPDHGAIDPGGEMYGLPGIFVSDGSAISAGTGVNPALTIGANALRIADNIVRTW